MRTPILLSFVALAGCTQSPSRYPSLLPRPIETQSLAEPTRPAPVATADAGLDARIATARAELEAGNARFVAAAQDAEAKIAVGRGLAEGSPAWLDAQTGLSTLDTLRAPTLTALSALEELAIERGSAGLVPYPALDEAIATARALAQAQGDRISALEAALAGA